MRALTVFCGSSDGNDASWRSVAYDLGVAMAERGITLVYGAGGNGLMGALAQGVLDSRGAVVGVIPHFMIEREWARHDLTELIRVQTMHERKAKMCELGDAVLALPGGLGTLEELVEIWSWENLDFISRPLGLLNVNGFWEPLLALTRHFEETGFMNVSATERLVVRDDVETALDALESAVRSRRP